jgi:hypothetical protein
MTERPILFSAPMVRAILRDVNPKTQTRRVMKPQPTTELREFKGLAHHVRGSIWRSGRPTIDLCPYGVPGDRLWVRETWTPADTGWSSTGDDDTVYVYYKADDDVRPDGIKPVFKVCSGLPIDMVSRWERKIDHAQHGGGDFWVPSIHMPRWASRITLEITKVRVERVQDISEGDARREGVEGVPGTLPGEISYRDPFARLWSVINAKRGYGWDVNPWVWVLEFKRIEVTR